MEASRAREDILSRIRGALAEAEGPGARVHRAYLREGSRTREQILDLFARRVSDYRATVVRTDPRGLAREVARALRAMGSRRVVVPADLPPAWLREVAPGEMDLLRDGGGGPGRERLSKGRLASSHGVLTGCAAAVAETGTLILSSGPGEGRRGVTLLPDHHVCVVTEDRILETVPEAVAAMSRLLAKGRRTFTLVSGPSATSDIELVRVEGVHGPRTLEVILVEGPA